MIYAFIIIAILAIALAWSARCWWWWQREAGFQADGFNEENESKQYWRGKALVARGEVAELLFELGIYRARARRYLAKTIELRDERDTVNRVLSGSLSDMTNDWADEQVRADRYKLCLALWEFHFPHAYGRFKRKIAGVLAGDRKYTEEAEKCVGKMGAKAEDELRTELGYP